MKTLEEVDCKARSYASLEREVANVSNLFLADKSTRAAAFVRFVLSDESWDQTNFVQKVAGWNDDINMERVLQVRAAHCAILTDWHNVEAYVISQLVCFHVYMLVPGCRVGCDVDYLFSVPSFSVAFYYSQRIKNGTQAENSVLMHIILM